MGNDNILFAMKCKLCKKEFIYCLRSCNDFRCYSCKKNRYFSVEEIEKELREMPKEEYESFMQDIKEYEEEFGNIPDDDEEEEEECD